MTATNWKVALKSLSIRYSAETLERCYSIEELDFRAKGQRVSLDYSATDNIAKITVWSQGLAGFAHQLPPALGEALK